MRETLLAALMVVAALAGCSGADTPQQGFAFVDGVCPAGFTGSCDVYPTDILHIRDFHIEATRRGGIGLHIQGLPDTRDLRLEDGTIEGPFDVAVLIEHTCAACEVVLDNVTIRGAHGAIHVRDAPFRVGLFGIDMELAGDQEFSSAPPRPAVAVEDVGRASLGEVRIATASPRAGFALTASAPSSEPDPEPTDHSLPIINLADVAVGGFAGGFDLAVHVMDVSEIDIACREVGIVFHWPGPYDGSNLNITGCRRQAMQFLAPHDLNFERISISDSHTAIEVQGGDSLYLTWFNLTRNSYGVRFLDSNVSRVGAVLQHGVVADNRYLGIETRHFGTRINNVTFLRNGHEWPDPADPKPRHEYGALVIAGTTVRNSDSTIIASTFEDNQPYAVTSLVQVPLVKAQQNWWGDPLGPRIRPLEDPAVPDASIGPGNGDHVSPGIIFIPFATSKP